MIFFVLAIRALASKLVEQWLKTVKGETVIPVSLIEIPQIIAAAQSEVDADGKSESDLKIVEETENPDKSIKLDDVKTKQETNAENLDIEKLKEEIKDDSEKDPDVLPVLKISVKDGKQVVSQVDDKEEHSDKEKSKDNKQKNKSRESDKISSSSKSSNSSKHSSKSHSSSSDKHKSSHKSSSSSRNSSKDSKDRSKDKERHSSHSSKSKSDNSRKSSEKSGSSSKSKEDKNAKSSDKKDKHKDDKNRDSYPKNEKSEEKPQSPPSIHKLGKIPKLSDSKKEKPSISIEVRKPDEPKPKTVKTFHSKFRKHGLEEEVKPPPSRATLLNKKTPVIPTLPAPKRPSPVHNETPPEKKPKTVDPVEKPGSIKLIPPKPKRKYIYEISKIIINIFFIFPGEHCYPDPLVIIVPSSFNSLGCVIDSGKSKIYNLTGSKLLTVKYLMQINAEITI